MSIAVHNLVTGAIAYMDGAMGRIEALRAAWLHDAKRTMDHHYGRDRTPTLVYGRMTVACGDWVVFHAHPPSEDSAAIAKAVGGAL